MSKLSGAEPRSGRSWLHPDTWHLRTKLVLVVMLLLVGICTVVGTLLYATMDRVLTQQLDGQLAQASHRAVEFGTASSGLRRDPLDAPGQGAGTLSARISNGVLVTSGLRTADGKIVSITQSDADALASIPVGGQGPGGPPGGGATGAVDRHLSPGSFRLVAIQVPNGDVVVTGLPLASMQATLGSLVLTTVTVSLGGLVLVGLLGTVIIRRTMKPLDELSRVAGQVAQLPLEAGEVALAVRVPDSASNPGTEVGQVGNALNRMLDNVAGALEARQASETKVRQFVADASHELRTPLTAIRGYTDMLRLTEPLTEQGAESLGRVESQSLRMSRLVEDLLTLARLDEGQPLKRGPVDLTQLLVETVTDQKVIAPDHVWRLELPEEPVEITADGAKLHQVLVNLLSNARKHTPAGTTVTAAAGRSATGEAVLTVTDNGPGIPPDLRDTVFSRFTRADKARTSTGEGSTGLGLSIVDAIVKAHGGSIDVTSRPGRTEFAVYLPAA
ncbi:two-component system OmpR family sensor kinase [Sinomonas atrocyanea]|uniref:HAMP domain-containing sensor histidine kinase n=1 Tax=Sinomonas atrocyanea TaxID=37927 RepID=UPI0027822839|nr:HAMP domain-containing sensor histidine kinase [Sinomonas atrocyanea]MDP9882724.1 two-component system OmpR family sensor kinase [Sinomonas atrocyanea]